MNSNAYPDETKTAEVITSSKRTGRIVLAGGSGFLGKILRRSLSAAGNDVVTLTRTPRSSHEILWDGETLGKWVSQLEGALAVINLAGKSVNCRYTARNRKLIMDSRINSTRILGEAISKCARPPVVWLNSSTATIYKHSLDRVMDEGCTDFRSTAEARDAFSVSVAQAWEKVLSDARTPQTRKTAMRTAMVLGTEEETVFRVLRRLTRWGLGGTMGNGNQYVSWIHEDDFCHAIEWLITHETIEGPVNLTAPEPIPNREMMRTLRCICKRCHGLPAAAWMLEVGALFMRTETELILKSRRVVPGRLLSSGFEFRFPTLETALCDLESRLKKSQGFGVPISSGQHSRIL